MTIKREKKAWIKKRAKIESLEGRIKTEEKFKREKERERET